MRIYKNQLDKQELEIAESLLFNGNGHIGVRNTLEENDYSSFTSNRHTYLNGFYDTYSISYPEQYFGAANVGEQMLPVIDGTLTEIYIGTEKVDTLNGNISEHQRYLDIAMGTSVRTYIYSDKVGNKTRINITRICSFTNKEQLATSYSFEKMNHNLDIVLKTNVRFTIDQNVDVNDPRVAHNKMRLNIEKNDLNQQQVVFTAPNSKVCGYFMWDISDISNISTNEDGIWITSKPNTNQFTKVYTYSLTNFIQPITCFEKLVEQQQEYLENFWKRGLVKIESTDDLQSAVNYGTYALLQSVGEKSIAAKGLSGIGYEGHVFWDAEMYVLPVFNRVAPVVAREMLMYRIEMLDQAIENRKHVGYPQGALYPWRTITGRESSAFFEAGMAQHHIGLDITYGLSRYIEQTADYSILDVGGFEMMVEIGKMFAAIVSEKDGKFHLNMVTGPDEYSALVNDNFYTNVLLREHYLNLINYNEKMKPGKRMPEQLVKQFSEIAEGIELPFESQLNIVKQDRDFLNKSPWPYPIIDDKPLLLKYHPLEIYRHQVSKQADVVLAMQLVGSKYYSDDVIANTINYYDQVTTHDSSLSFSSYATVYARLKDKRAYQYFLKNARLDLDNLHHNTRDGIHTAAMGGTYQTIIDGFSNYHIKNDRFVVENLLPKEITYLEYNLEFKQELYKVILKGNDKPQVIKIEEK